MTPQEALKVLENEKECIQRQVNGNCDNKRDCVNCDLRLEDKEIILAYNTAISALEKQIPKKPTPHIVKPVEAPIKIGNGRWQKGTTVYKCPNCKEWVSKTYKHCHDCGQALDFNSNGSGTE